MLLVSIGLVSPKPPDVRREASIPCSTSHASPPSARLPGECDHRRIPAHFPGVRGQFLHAIFLRYIAAGAGIFPQENAAEESGKLQAGSDVGERLEFVGRERSRRQGLGGAPGAAAEQCSDHNLGHPCRKVYSCPFRFIVSGKGGASGARRDERIQCAPWNTNEAPVVTSDPNNAGASPNAAVRAASAGRFCPASRLCPVEPAAPARQGSPRIACLLRAGSYFADRSSLCCRELPMPLTQAAARESP
jgi:hypothetical protein